MKPSAPENRKHWIPAFAGMTGGLPQATAPAARRRAISSAE